MQCGGNMEKEERVDDTKKADISVEVVWVCEECSYEVIIDNDEY